MRFVTLCHGVTFWNKHLKLNKIFLQASCHNPVTRDKLQLLKNCSIGYTECHTVTPTKRASVIKFCNPNPVFPYANPLCLEQCVFGALILLSGRGGCCAALRHT